MRTIFLKQFVLLLTQGGMGDMKHIVCELPTHTRIADLKASNETLRSFLDDAGYNDYKILEANYMINPAIVLREDEPKAVTMVYSIFIDRMKQNDERECPNMTDEEFIAEAKRQEFAYDCSLNVMTPIDFQVAFNDERISDANTFIRFIQVPGNQPVLGCEETKAQIMEALGNYEGGDFTVTDELTDFIRELKLTGDAVSYLLFMDEQAWDIYSDDNGGAQAILDYINAEENINECLNYCVVKVDDNSKPDKLLQAYDGDGGTAPKSHWAYITEQEYNLLKD